MEQKLEVDFSEIASQADDSWAFVDSNIFESARKDLEKEKQNRDDQSSQNQAINIDNKESEEQKLFEYRAKETS